MLTRWAAWPRGVRWLSCGIAAVALAAFVWALFVPIADLLAHHDVGSATGPLHETALDNARGRLLTLGAGLLAAVALWFTARTFALSREGQVTDRYTKAIEQLGSDKIDVRIGGIYALERIARDSARDHPVVMEVLTAFVREHSRKQWPEAEPGAEARQRTTRPDVQAAVTVIGRRNPGHDRQPVDLAGADLTGADLSNAHLTRAYLTGADLTRALLISTDLRGAYLGGADLRGACLRAADLGPVIVRSASGRVSSFLPGAYLDDAQFTSADLTGAKWPRGADVPDGWKLDRSGRLRRAGTDPGPPYSGL